MPSCERKHLHPLGFDRCPNEAAFKLVTKGGREYKACERCVIVFIKQMVSFETITIIRLPDRKHSDRI